MKNVFILALLLFSLLSYGQDCNTQAANKPSTWGRSPDSFQDGGVFTPRKPASLDITKTKSNLGKTEAWINNRLKGFTGAKLDNQNSYFFDPLDFVADKNEEHNYGKAFYMATGMKGYSYNIMRFFAYYCYDNKLPLFTEDESGSSIKVIFNNVFASPLCADVDLFKVNGNRAFKIFEKDHTNGRFDFYDLRAKYTGDDIYTSYTEIIIVRNSDKPVFIPITRKEYLEQMLQDIDTYKTKQRDFLNNFYETQIKEFEREIGIYKANDKQFTAEKEAKRRKAFNENVNPEKLAKDLAKLEEEVNGGRQVITEYLGKPQEWLNRGFNSFYPWSFEKYTPLGVKKYLDGLDTFTESREDRTRTEVVYINPAYYDRSGSGDVPQLIAVVVTKGRYPHMLKVSALLKEPGALAPLEAIVNPAKSTSPWPSNKE